MLTAPRLRLWISRLTMHGNGKLSAVPQCWQLAISETAVYYSPSLQRMQQATGKVHNVYIAYSNEKRTITRSPITDPDGNIFLFQLLWEGTTDLCHLKMSPAVALHISSLIAQRLHYPVSKCSGNFWTRHFAIFRSGFISHCGLKILWEI